MLIGNLKQNERKNEGTSETELRANVPRSLEQSARKNRVKCCSFAIEFSQVVGWGWWLLRQFVPLGTRVLGMIYSN